MTQIKTVQVSDATDAQLLEYAQQNLPNVHPNTGREKLLAMVAQAAPNGSITVSDEAEEAVDPHPTIVPETGRDKNGELLVKVQLNAPGDDENPQPALVGVNGKMWRIQFNKPVDVPFSVYEALNNAMVTSVTQNKAGKFIHNTRHTYPFNLLAPPMAEIQAYRDSLHGVEAA